MKTLTLDKVFPSWYNDAIGGIFKTLADKYGNEFEWLNAKNVLDVEYFGNHSGNKPVAVLIERFIEENIENKLDKPFTLTEDQRATLADIIYNRYKVKWQKLYAVLSLEYNPIENYSMVEEETPNISRKHTVSDDYATSDEKKTKTDYTVESENENDVDSYGFNSETPVPTGDSSGTSKTRTQGDADNNVETSTHRQTGYTEETESGDRKLTRAGNIGVTTSQQLIESEVELWKWNFFDTVYSDLDKVLTLPIYIN